MKTTTLPLKHSINRAPFRLALLISFLLACFALSPQARAACQQGCDTSTKNTFLGDDALVNNTSGFQNTATGAFTLQSNTTGYLNTAIGYSALFSNTTATANTTVGDSALKYNTGSGNTAVGTESFLSNTTGVVNTACGQLALFINTTGRENTAMGWETRFYNKTGGFNTAVGFNALFNDSDGSNNTAIGAYAFYGALDGNSNASNNTVMGASALYSSITGANNTAVGYKALFNTTTGSSNIAIGNSAGINRTTGSNNIDIGNVGVAGESRTIRIGTAGTQTKTFIAGIRGKTTQNADGIPVLIDSAGQLGTVSSSRRFKQESKLMDQTSEAILGLKPVTFHYKSDSECTSQFGLIAEEVAEVNPDLVVRDENGQIYTVRYNAVNAMLLNEFLKEHREVQELKKQVAALTAGLEKVSPQLEVSKTAPQTVLNNK